MGRVGSVDEGYLDLKVKYKDFESQSYKGWKLLFGRFKWESFGIFVVVGQSWREIRLVVDQGMGMEVGKYRLIRIVLI